MTALILLSVTLIFILAFGFNHILVGRMLKASIESGAFHLTQATVNRIDAVLQAVEKVPANLSRFLEDAELTGNALQKAIENVLEANPEVYGTAVAFEPDAFAKGLNHFALYGFRSVDGLAFTTIPYDYMGWDWYRLPMDENRPRWSEPYFDEGAGNTLMATFSVPFSRQGPDGPQRVGVMTADISLAWLRDLAEAIKIANSGYAFIVSAKGTFITHPRAELVMNQTIFSLARSLADETVEQAGKAMIAGKSGFVPAGGLLSGKGWLAYAFLPSSGWSIGVVFPEEELMGDLDRPNRQGPGPPCGG